jgi:hypothetical protein
MVTREFKQVDLPNFKDGYQEWRDAFEEGLVGVDRITLAEAVSVVEARLNQ